MVLSKGKNRGTENGHNARGNVLTSYSKMLKQFLCQALDQDVVLGKSKSNDCEMRSNGVRGAARGDNE